MHDAAVRDNAVFSQPTARPGAVSAMKTALITGAPGGIGTHLRRELAGHYALRLSDVRDLQP
jgi:hypothetical protein